MKLYDLDRLLELARQGNRAAEARLRDELEQQLKHMVRHTVQSKNGSTPITQLILAEVRQLEGNIGEQEMIQQVALKISEAVLGHVGAAIPAHGVIETVRS